jgi:lipoprotein-anchoring transpeptidase ErfK/SrfK
MIRHALPLLASSAAVLLFGSAAPSAQPSDGATGDTRTPATVSPAAAPQPAPQLTPQPASPPSAQQALENGVLIVVSLPRQKMFVFKDGALWGSSPVSTGRKGHGTPVGLFPILQKAVHHRSTLYNSAPMPYMQRLTWGGVALHGGHVPGYKASHGCIRVPHAFAKKLFAITNMKSTAVLVTREPVASAATAVALARDHGSPEVPVAKRVELAAGAPGAAVLAPAPATEVRVQTIQLIAAQSPQNAATYWQQLVQREPELASLQHQIIPAVVNSRQYYRLRATGLGAAVICSDLAARGVACLRVSA